MEFREIKDQSVWMIDNLNFLMLAICLNDE